MFKKILGLAVAAVMMLAVFGLTACDNVSLDEYKATKSTELQTYADSKGRDNYCADGWAAVCQAVTDGKSAVAEATSKPQVDTAVKDAKGAIDWVLKEDEMADILGQFDLTDPKEFWAGTIADDFEIDRVVVIMKKTTTYPELELRDFGLSNGKSLEYSNLKPQDNMLSDLDYIERYRQIVIIYLKHEGKDKVIEAVEQLSQLDFVKYAGPEMLYTGGDD